MNRLAYMAILGLLATGIPDAGAQAMIDPTRPPPGWMPGENTAKVEKSQGSSTEPVQLLLVGKTRRFAIVRGDLVGDKTRGTRLVEVKRNDIVVRSDAGRETLNLFPDVKKTPPRKPPGLGKKEQ
jgi:hypothetical protein